jgi:hypothetical protein
MRVSLLPLFVLKTLSSELCPALYTCFQPFTFLYHNLFFLRLKILRRVHSVFYPGVYIVYLSPKLHSISWYCIYISRFYVIEASVPYHYVDTVTTL